MLTYDMHNYTAPQNAPIAAPTFVKHNRLNEKYSLRQRDKRKCNNNNNKNYSDEPEIYIMTDKNNKNKRTHLGATMKTQMNQLLATTTTTTTANSYRTKRTCLAPATKTTTTATVVTKAKTKAAPLSKYRRKTANARERTRMREINTAFEQLRHCVPPTIIGEDSNTTNEKLTKITTLRLAMKYIQTLTQALENPQTEAELLQELELAGDLRFTSDYNPLQQQQEEPQVPFDDKNTVKTVKCSPKLKNNGKTKTAQNKRTKNRKQHANKTNKTHKSKNSNIVALSPASTSSAYSSQYSNVSYSCLALNASDISNTSTIYENTNFAGLNQIDMSNMLLESDGESLHLSEHCLSPLAGNNSNHLFNTASAHAHNFANFDTTMALTTLENPLELSLRLLDAEDVADHQQPSACISPLSGLDTFCDLLGADFPEHSSLDMFLT